MAKQKISQSIQDSQARFSNFKILFLNIKTKSHICYGGRTLAKSYTFYQAIINHLEQDIRQISLSLSFIAEYILTDEAKKLLTEIPKPFAVVSVAGPYRTGKSYLLNRMILNRDTGFGVGPTVNPCTKGIWVWSELLKGTTADGDPINVLVVDTQGLGALDEDQTHDTKVFTLAVLMASCFIYNSVGTIDQGALDNLALVVQMSKSLQQKTQTINLQDISTGSPNFIWVVRDFCLSLEDASGYPISSKEYLERALQQQNGFSDETDHKNKIRRHMTCFFPERDCFTFSRPIKNDTHLHELSGISLSDLKPDFVEQVLNFRRKLLTKLKPKCLLGNQVSGAVFVMMLEKYIECINQGAIPNIESTWTYVSQKHSYENVQRCLDKIVSFQDDCLRKLPQPPKLVEDWLRSIKQDVLQYLQLNSLGADPKAIRQVKQELKKLKSKLKQENQIATRRHMQKQLAKRFGLIQKQLQTGKYRSFSEYESELASVLKPTQAEAQLPDSSSVIFQFMCKCLKQGAQSFERRSTLRVTQIEAEKQRHRLQLEARCELKQSQVKECQKQLLQIRVELVQREAKEEIIIEEAKKQYNRQLLEKDEILKRLTEKLGECSETHEKLLKELRTRAAGLEEELSEANKAMLIKENDYDTEKLLLQQKLGFAQKILEDAKKRSQLLEEQAAQSNLVSLRTLRDTITKKDCRIAELLTEINALKQAQQLHIVKMKRQSTEDIQKYQQQIKNLQSKLSQKSSTKFLEESTISRTAFQELTRAYTELERSKLNLATAYQQLEAKRQNTVEESKANKLKLETSIAILQQQLEFNSVEHRDLKQKHQQLADRYLTAEKRLEQMSLWSTAYTRPTSQVKISIQEVQKVQATHQIAFRVLKTEKQELQQKLAQKTLSLALMQQSSKQTIQQLTKQVSLLKTRESQTLAKCLQIESERKRTLDSLKNEYEQKVALLQGQLQHETVSRHRHFEQSSVEVEQQVTHLKNYYEQERFVLQRKIREEKDKIEAKWKLKLQQTQDSYKQEISTLEMQLSEVKSQFETLMLEHTLLKRDLSNQIQIHQSKCNSLEKQLEETSKVHKSQIKTINQACQKEVSAQHTHSLALEIKLETVGRELLLKQKCVIKLQSQLKQSDSRVAQLQEQLAEQAQQRQNEKEGLENTIQNLKQKHQSSLEEWFNKQITLQKELALAKQTNQFQSLRIKELESNLNSSKEAWIAQTQELKKALQQDKKEKVAELQAQLDRLAHKYQVLKKSMKELEAQANKQLAQDRHNLALCEEKLANSINQIQILEASHKAEVDHFRKQIQVLQTKHSQAKSKLEVEIGLLKSQIEEIESEYSELQGNYDKDSVLWRGKVNFLQQQKEQMKRDSAERTKKLEQALEFMHKTRSDRSKYSSQSLPEIIANMEAKYQARADELSNNHLKKILALEQKIRLMETELKCEKEKNMQQSVKTSTAYYQKLLEQAKEKERRLSKELQRARDELGQSENDFHAELAKERETSKQKVRQLEAKLREADRSKSFTLFQHQKEKAKWHQEKGILQEANSELRQSLKLIKQQGPTQNKQNIKTRAPVERRKLSAVKVTSSLGSSRWDDYKFESNKGHDYSIFNSSQLLSSSGSPGKSHMLKESDLEIQEDY